ncbi:MAG: hypothetical protein FWC59_03445 [Actinomycetia bacterium]|nr:hypothetical protein [Actinomycetes bacterium]
MKKSWKLPVDLRQLRQLISGTASESERSLVLELLVDESISSTFCRAAAAAFRPSNARLTVRPLAYSAAANLPFGSSNPTATGQDLPFTPGSAVALPINLDNVLPAVATTADLSIILAAASPWTAALLLRVAARGRDVVIVCEDVAAFQAAWPLQLLDLDTSRLVAVSATARQQQGLSALFANLGKWIVQKQPDKQLAWARNLAFVRAALTSEAIQSTALQNGVFATAVFLPGADLPVLLFNQMRMFLKLAVIQGREMNAQRYLELAVLLLAALGWRGLARRLVRWIPTVGWAIRGTVGYVATLLTGQAARAYLSLPAGREDPADER